jgi:alkylation response protein AidB-like acyl-CoA dehydrogenase
MDFAVSDKMKSMLATIREFMVNEVYPIEREVGEKGFNASLPLLKEKRDRVKKAGLWAPQMHVEHGGLGLSVLEHGMVSAEFGRSLLGH